MKYGEFADACASAQHFIMFRLLLILKKRVVIIWIQITCMLVGKNFVPLCIYSKNSSETKKIIQCDNSSWYWGYNCSLAFGPLDGTNASLVNPNLYSSFLSSCPKWLMFPCISTDPSCPSSISYNTSSASVHLCHDWKNNTVKMPPNFGENCLHEAGLLQTDSLWVYPKIFGCFHHEKYLRAGQEVSTCEQSCWCHAGGHMSGLSVVCWDNEDCKLLRSVQGCHLKPFLLLDPKMLSVWPAWLTWTTNVWPHLMDRHLNFMVYVTTPWCRCALPKF